jgi:hypothetical protein
MRWRKPGELFIERGMSVRLVIFLVAACGWGALGCQAPYKKTDQAAARAKKDQSEDVSFKAFVGLLQTAVAKKDLPTLASMMSADFGYRWDPPPEGDNVFVYWDEHRLWPVLASVLKERFAPNETRSEDGTRRQVFMVAPPPDPNYRGHRVGLVQLSGAWKFAYFVSGEGL